MNTRKQGPLGAMFRVDYHEVSMDLFPEKPTIDTGLRNPALIKGQIHNQV